MEQMRSAYLRLPSGELKRKLSDLNRTLLRLKNPKTHDGVHRIMNIIIDILKERNEL